MSSPFKMSFKGSPVMVGDAITHPGMSGRPVMMLLKDPLSKDERGKLSVKHGHKYILAGVYSAQFEVFGKVRRHLINIWFPEVIEWILKENASLKKT